MAIIAACAFCVSCASVSRPEKPVLSLLEARRKNVVVQEWDISCGAAALATVLTYQHGDAVTEKQVAEAMLRRTDPLKVKIRSGFSLLDLKRFTESRGFRGSGYLKLRLSDLQKLGPAIVPLDLGDYKHFVVFRGVVGNRVLLADPAFGNRTIDINTFEKSWLQNIGFVISRRDGKSAPNRLTPQPIDFVRASSDTVRHALR